MHSPNVQAVELPEEVAPAVEAVVVEEPSQPEPEPEVAAAVVVEEVVAEEVVAESSAAPVEEPVHEFADVAPAIEVPVIATEEVEAAEVCLHALRKERLLIAL